MYAMYENNVNGEDLLYEYDERTSDIGLPPVMNALLLAGWIFISLIGFAVIFLVKNPVAGALIIAVPTFIGMVIKPTFALCMMMLVLPTGAGIGYRQAFSLDRGVGIALAASFLLNILITQPRLRIRNRALWVLIVYTIWVVLTSLAAPYIGMELRRAFTQIQLLALVFIVYWIVETNGPNTFRWALRAYVLGTLGTIALAFITGTAIRAIEETPEGRYAATLGQAINANMLAALTGMAFLAAIYLFARDKSILWRIIYLVAILLLPFMLIRIGSRGNLVALTFTLLSPFIFVRQVLRKPALAALLMVIIILASASTALVVRSRGVEAGVATRLTDIGLSEEAISYRMEPIKQAIKSVTRKPTGTSYYGWFEQTGLLIWPHSDFFLILGVYGIPGAILFILFVFLMLSTIRRTPMCLEKLYTRAVLTYFLVVGMNNAYVYKKFYWAFLALVMAGERIASIYTEQSELLSPGEGEELLDVSQAY